MSMPHLGLLAHKRASSSGLLYADNIVTGPYFDLNSLKKFSEQIANAELSISMFVLLVALPVRGRLFKYCFASPASGVMPSDASLSHTTVCPATMAPLDTDRASASVAMWLAPVHGLNSALAISGTPDIKKNPAKSTTASRGVHLPCVIFPRMLQVYRGCHILFRTPVDAPYGKLSHTLPSLSLSSLWTSSLPPPWPGRPQSPNTYCASACVLKLEQL